MNTKTKPITITVNVPDNGNPHHVTVTVADSSPVSQDDSDRARLLARKVWVVGAGETTARSIG